MLLFNHLIRVLQRPRTDNDFAKDTREPPQESGSTPSTVNTKDFQEFTEAMSQAMTKGFSQMTERVLKMQNPSFQTQQASKKKNRYTIDRNRDELEDLNWKCLAFAISDTKKNAFMVSINIFL